MGQHVETTVEPRCKLLDPERDGAGRGQLDRQRDAVEPPADRGDQRSSRVVCSEMRLRRARPVDKEPNRTVKKQIGVRCGICRRHIQRWHRVNPFPFHPERLAARCNDLYRGAGSQRRLDHFCGGADHMLAIVQHQQQPPAGEPASDALRRSIAATQFQPDSRRQRWQEPSQDP